MEDSWELETMLAESERMVAGFCCEQLPNDGGDLRGRATGVSADVERTAGVRAAIGV
jgi:hypothetical protein